MATSGTTTVTYTAADIILRACHMANVVAFGAPTVPGKILIECLSLLNMLVKQWESKGLHLHKKEELRLTLVANRHTYKFGSNADKVESEKYSTATFAAAASGDTTIDVLGATTDIDNGDTIDVYLSDNTVHTTTVNGTPAGISGGIRVTLTTALDGAAASGAFVKTWQSDTRVPESILRAYTQTVSTDTKTVTNSEIAVCGIDEWMQNPTPRSDGNTISLHYHKTLTEGFCKIWPQPDATGDLIKLDCLMPIEIFSSQTDDVDMLPDWNLALVYGLAKVLIDSHPDKQYDSWHRTHVSNNAKEALELAEEASWTTEEFEITHDLSEYYEGEG